MTSAAIAIQGISPAAVAVFEEAARQGFSPPPRITLTEWAERNIVLSSEDSAEAGSPYRSSRAPYQREMQDVVLQPHIEEVVFKTSAQVGKTLILKNVLAYFVKEDPSPIIWMTPTLELAKRVSTQRLAPMFRDNKSLANLIEVGARKSGSRVLEKTFHGGVLFMVGANSPAALSSMPARILLADEEDRYPASAGAEGNPVKLAKKRQTTYWNRKTIRASTPTIENDSAIDAAYENSDQRQYYVPCPHCSQAAGRPDGFQTLKWKRLQHGKEPLYEDTVYPCEFCGVALAEFDKPWMLQHGEWRTRFRQAEIELERHLASHGEEISDCKACDGLREALDKAPRPGKVAGFWINELYSPFVKWSEMVAEFREAARHRENPELLKTFINLSLAETYREESEVLDGNELMKRREDYPPPALPDGVTVLTAGVDVQQNRLEVEVVGWGKGEESWSIDFLRFEGDTVKLKGTPENPSAWEKLDAFLLSARYLHARGLRISIAAVMVDSGYHTQEVYQWTKGRNARRIFASKGVTGFGKPPLGKWHTNNRHRVRLYPIAVDVIKESIYKRLALQEPGAAYMHFSRENMSSPFLPDAEATRIGNDQDYFAQLTAEKIKPRYLHGYRVRSFELRVPGSRNEALDCRVYAYAAFLSLSEKPERMLERERKSLLARARQLAAERRQKVSPDQLPLLDGSADVRTDPAAADLGAEEHKLVSAVEKTEAPAASPAPPPNPAPLRHRQRVQVKRRW